MQVLKIKAVLSGPALRWNTRGNRRSHSCGVAVEKTDAGSRIRSRTGCIFRKAANIYIIYLRYSPAISSFLWPEWVFFGNIVSTECFLNGCMQLSYKVPTATIWRERCIWVREEWSILWSEHWPLSQDKVCAELKQITSVLFCQTGAVSVCGVVDLDHSFPALPTICQPNLNHNNSITSVLGIVFPVLIQSGTNDEGLMFSTSTQLTAVVNSGPSCCFWYPLIPLFWLPNVII